MERIRRFSFLFGLLYAQALPDSIWFLSAGGDTLSLTVFQIKGPCWGSTLYKREPAGWRSIRYDTFCVDERQRLTIHLGYDSTGSILLSRVMGTYPSPREAIFTQEKYESPQRGWIPERRLHLWGINQRWDSVFSGWYGVWFLGANSIQGSPLWCHPLMTTPSQWGDSLLYEEFLPSAQLFVERGGYIKTAHALVGCDSMVSYAGLRLRATPQGSHILCKNATSQLVAIRESLSIDTIRAIIERNLSRNAQGLVVSETFTTRRYTLSGLPLGSSTYTLRYHWDSNSRLTEAHYAAGVYYLRYHRAQIVGFPEIITPLGLQDRRTHLRVYTLLGSYLGELPDADTGLLNLPPGIYLLEEGGTTRKIFISP